MYVGESTHIPGRNLLNDFTAPDIQVEMKEDDANSTSLSGGITYDASYLSLVYYCILFIRRSLDVY